MPSQKQKSKEQKTLYNINVIIKNILYIRPNAILQKTKLKKKMEQKIENQNEEALVNAFKMEVLEERLEMRINWGFGGGCGTETCPPN